MLIINVLTLSYVLKKVSVDRRCVGDGFIVVASLDRKTGALIQTRFSHNFIGSTLLNCCLKSIDNVKTTIRHSIHIISRKTENFADSRDFSQVSASTTNITIMIFGHVYV
jgi:hypothetical protein